MKPIYQNFDGLDVSFTGAFPEETLEILRAAKEQAIRNNYAKTITCIGASQIAIQVYPTGSRGGYAFVFDTGPDGAIWFIKDSIIPRAGNIRLSLTSLNLALNGYAAARDRILCHLVDIGVIGVFEDENSLPFGLPPKSIMSRVDYCFDFITDNDFEPDPKNFVTHPRTTVTGILTEDIKFALRGGYYQSVMVGKMPNRQTVIYDKTAEIISHHKPYWWALWGLDPEKFKGRIWRVETRAGKNELDNWNIKTFEDLETKIGDVFQKNLTATRYTERSKDSNRSRWPVHPLWESCQETAKDVLAPYTSNATRKKVITDLREVIQARAIKNMRGSVATFNHLLGHAPDEVSKTLEFIAEDVFDYANSNQSDFFRKIKKAEDKYLFLDES